MNDNNQPAGFVSVTSRYLSLHRSSKCRSTDSLHSERAGYPRSRKTAQRVPAAGVTTIFDKLRDGAAEIVQICDQASPKKRHKSLSPKLSSKDLKLDSAREAKHRKVLERVRKLLTSLLEELGPSLGPLHPQDEDEMINPKDEVVDSNPSRPSALPDASHLAAVQVFGLDMNERAKIPRKPYSEERRKETHNTRKRGACPECKKSRKRCKEEHALIRVPAKAGPILLKPKPDDRREEPEEEDLVEQLQPADEPESPEEYMSVSNTVIHSPRPTRASSNFNDLFSGFNGFSPGTLFPRQTTPEYPRLHAGLPRALVRKPSLPEVSRASSNPSSWSNYRKHHGQRRSLDDLEIDQYIARVWPKDGSNISGFDISPMMLQSDEECLSPISPGPAVGHPSNLAFVPADVASVHSHAVQEGSTVATHPSFSVQTGHDLHSITAEHDATPIDLQGAQALDLLHEHPEKHCNGSCGIAGRTCQTIAPQIPPEEPRDILQDLVSDMQSISPARPTTSIPKPHARSSFGSGEAALPGGFAHQHFQNQSHAEMNPFDNELEGFDPELLAFFSIPSSIPQVFRRTPIMEAASLPGLAYWEGHTPRSPPIQG